MFARGTALAACVGVVAYRAKALDASGAFAATVVGGAIFGALGTRGASVLLAFFVPSIALSRVGRTRKRALLADVEKTGARDWRQVFANGGAAALAAIYARDRDARRLAAFAGAFAAASGDTWATEVGALAPGRPRSILTFRPVATGLSGGVSGVGTLAEIAGAAFVASIASAVFDLPRRTTAAIAIAGVAGATADSLLGASAQALRYCDACGRATERETHTCGTPTRVVRGSPFFGNDGVNYAATIVGAIVAYALSA